MVLIESLVGLWAKPLSVGANTGSYGTPRDQGGLRTRIKLAGGSARGKDLETWPYPYDQEPRE
jgi:hypothetical protein